jgi:SAM-dependent methyltransferase
MDTQAADQDRLEREREFHNDRFSDETRLAQAKYYWAIEEGARLYSQVVERLAEGADIFELGCAKGDNTFDSKGRFRSASGIDISDVAIAEANERARRIGATNMNFICGDAEDVPLPSESVDLVYGSGIVHHLNVERCAKEVLRLLRPSGAALFWEPLGHNFAFNLYRRLTPNVRTEDEHPLLRSDFALLGRHFPSLESRFFGLTTLATVPARGSPALKWTRSIAEVVDRGVLALPGLRWQAWYALVALRKMRGGGSVFAAAK